MLVTNHVLAGALLGYAVPNPVASFAVGVLSHLALDAVPHWGDLRPIRQLLHIAVPDGLVGATAMVTIAATTDRGRRTRVITAMAGSALLDLDKPTQLFFGFSPFPRTVDDVHARVQREAPHRMPQEVLVGVVAAAAVAALTWRARVADG